LIDLTLFYNAALDEDWSDRSTAFERDDLSELPRGRSKFAGVEFDVRGLVQLSGVQFKNSPRLYPESVEGIRLDRKCHQIHFLHATTWTAAESTQVGSYRVHYATGQQREIPIVYGKDVRDVQADQDKPVERAIVAWKKTRRLLKSTWVNPEPDAAITTIDYISKMTDSAPFLVAITVD
jgi:hypothetical protein